jgi:hypothetical protein
MNNLSQRLDDLERYASQFKEPIDDEIISAVLAGEIRNPTTVKDALDHLLDLIRPAIHASINRAGKDSGFCAGRGIDLPPPVGVLDLYIRRWRKENKPAWDNLERRVVTWIKAGEQADNPVLSLAEMKAYLVMHHLPKARTSETKEWFGEPPYLPPEDADRLVRLVRPIDPPGEPDLPLLLWKDSEEQIKTSWPADYSDDIWVPIDVGLDAPQRLFLAQPPVVDQDQPDPGSQPAELPRRIPSHAREPISDAELVALATRDRSSAGDSFETEMLDRVFLRIEPYLLASIIAGAQSLRMARASNLELPTPQTAVNQAAHLVSYGPTEEMPTEVADACEWAIPDRYHYEFDGGKLSSKVHWKGEARGALVFRILEKYGLRFLRSLELTDEIVPLAHQPEADLLLTLISPLQWNPDPDLPLLLWRDPTSALKTSSPAMSGQIRTISDISPTRSDLYLADHEADHVIPERSMFVIDNYRPDWSSFRGRQQRRQRDLLTRRWTQ